MTVAVIANPFGQSAKEYLDKGWRPIPMTKGLAKKDPPPGATGRNGQVTKDDVEKWARSRRPRNIGLRLEGVIGVDVDEYANKSGAEEFQKLEARLGALPPTYSSTSRGADSPARIRFFRVPDDAEFRGKGLKGGSDIDIIQRKHRYAVVHPSVHPSTGAVYQWYSPEGKPCGVPNVADLPDLPAAWLEELRTEARQYDPTAAVVGLNEILERSPEHRDCALTGQVDFEISVAKHIGHEEMFRYQYRLLCLARDGHAGVHVVLDKLHEIFFNYARAARDGGDAEASSEWERALRDGVVKVQQDTARLTGTTPGCTCWSSDVAELSDPPMFEQVKQYAPEPRWLKTNYATDSGNAERVAQVISSGVKWVSGLGWLVWNGRVWERSDDAVRELIRRMARRGWDDLAAATKESPDGQVAGYQVQHVKYLNSARGVENTMTLLRSMPEVFGGDPGEWDAQPHLVAVPNGTVDLTTGELLPHRREDRLTRMLQVEYRPSATAPRWEQFLGEVFPGKSEVADYVQRLFGYSLTGFNSEQVFPVFYGKRGANGKSVMLDVLMDIFGPLGSKILRDSLNADAGGKKETTVANLRGRRLALLSETGVDLQLDEAAVKELTGDAVMKGRELYSKEFSYQRTFQILLVTNHKPDFRSQGDALWRRVRLVEFPRFFEEHEREEGLVGRLVNNEAEGILAWLVRGAVAWSRAGKLQTPDAVLRATRSYQASTDKLEAWLSADCVRGPDERMLAGAAWVRYKEWAEDSQGQADFRTNRAFYAALEEKGIDKVPGAKNQRFLSGVRLKTDAERRQDSVVTDSTPVPDSPF